MHPNIFRADLSIPLNFGMLKNQFSSFKRLTFKKVKKKNLTTQLQFSATPRSNMNYVRLSLLKRGETGAHGDRSSVHVIEGTSNERDRENLEWSIVQQSDE